MWVSSTGTPEGRGHLTKGPTVFWHEPLVLVSRWALVLSDPRATLRFSEEETGRTTPETKRTDKWPTPQRSALESECIIRLGPRGT